MQARILRRLISCNLTNYNLKNQSRQIFCKRQPTPLYNLRLAYPSDYGRVIQFMRETYLSTEPSIVNLGLCDQAPNCPLLIHVMQKHVGQGLTIIAEDRDGCVAGAAVNVILEHTGPKGPGPDCCGCEKCAPARDLLQFFAYVSLQTDLWRVYRVGSVFECAHLAVHPEHQGQGLGKRLVEESWVLARDLAHRLFRIDCSSRYTANIAENFAWKCIYSIPYQRYFANGQFVFKNVQEPHTELKVFVDRLDYYAGYYPRAKKPAKRTY